METKLITDQPYWLLVSKDESFVSGWGYYNNGCIEYLLENPYTDDYHADWGWYKILAYLPKKGYMDLKGLPRLPAYFDITGDDDKRPKPNYCFAVVTGGKPEHCVFPACHCGRASAATRLEPTIEYDFENEVMDTIYQHGTKDNGVYTLTSKQMEDVANELKTEVLNLIRNLQTRDITKNTPEELLKIAGSIEIPKQIGLPIDFIPKLINASVFSNDALIPRMVGGKGNQEHKITALSINQQNVVEGNWIYTT